MKKHILYFTRDFSPENVAFAKASGLKMRNVNAYHDADSLEMADLVCGEVPKRYQHLPRFEIVKPETKAETQANTETKTPPKTAKTKKTKEVNNEPQDTE